MTKIGPLPQAAGIETAASGAKPDEAVPKDIADWLKALDEPMRQNLPARFEEDDAFRAPPGAGVAPSIAEWLAKKEAGAKKEPEESDAAIKAGLHPARKPPKQLTAKDAPANVLQDARVAAPPALAAMVLRDPTPPADGTEMENHPAPAVVALPGEQQDTKGASRQIDGREGPQPIVVTFARQETHLPPITSLPSQIAAAIVQHVNLPETDTQSVSAGSAPVAAVIETRPARPTQVLTLQLEPADLGLVDIRLRLSGDSLRVQIDAGRAETLALLDRDQHGLRKAIESAGYQLDDLTIQSGSVAAPGVKAMELLRIEPTMVETGSSPRGQTEFQNRPPDPSHAFFENSAQGDGQNRRPPDDRRGSARREPHGVHHPAAFVLRNGHYV